MQLQSRRVRLAMSTSLIVTSVVLYVTYFTLLAYAPDSSEPASQFKLSAQTQLLTAGTILIRESFVALSYPREMRANQTLPVELTYSARRFATGPDPRGIVDDLGPFQEVATDLDASLNVSLTSSGFDTSPAESVEKTPGTSLPISFVWTITPKSEGEHYCLLRVAEADIEGAVRQSGGRAILAPSATINGVPVVPEASGVYKLPITVTTYWGISQFWVSVITGLIAIIGFFLAWDIFVAYLKRRFGLEDK